MLSYVGDVLVVFLFLYRLYTFSDTMQYILLRFRHSCNLLLSMILVSR